MTFKSGILPQAFNQFSLFAWTFRKTIIFNNDIISCVGPTTNYKILGYLNLFKSNIKNGIIVKIQVSIHESQKLDFF